MRDPEHWWRRDELTGDETHRPISSDPDRGPASSPRIGRALGERKKRKGISRNDGAQTDRRHFQCWSRGALSLERFGAKPGRVPALGGRWRGQRTAAMVYEILRHAPR